MKQQIILLLILGLHCGVFAQPKKGFFGKLKDKLTQTGSTSSGAAGPTGTGDRAIPNKKMPAKMVLATGYYPDFETASKHATDKIDTKDSLWLFVKFNEPIKNYAAAFNYVRKDKSVISVPCLRIEYGQVGFKSEETQCVIWFDKSLTDELELEDVAMPSTLLEKNEFAICISDYRRNMSTNFVLKSLSESQFPHTLRLMTTVPDPTNPGFLLFNLAGLYEVYEATPWKTFKELVLFYEKMSKRGDEFAQMVLTKSYYPDYAAAAQHPADKVQDGDSLWMYVRFGSPVKDFVYIHKIEKDDGSVSKIPTLRISIGPPLNYDNTFNITHLAFKKDNALKRAVFLDEKILDKTEFCLLLSGYKKYQSAQLLLETVGKGTPGVWVNELRVHFKDKLITQNIICDVEDGIPKYKKAWEYYEKIWTKGEAENNELPAKGKFMDAAVKAKLLEYAKTKGWVVKQCYFEQDDWSLRTHSDYSYDRYRTIAAVVSYKKGGSCYYSSIIISQDYSWGYGRYQGDFKMEILEEDIPLLCTNY